MNGEHLGYLVGIVGLVLSGYGALAKALANQTLKQISDTQAGIAKSLEELWRQFSPLKDEFHELRGVCKTRHEPKSP